MEEVRNDHLSGEIIGVLRHLSMLLSIDLAMTLELGKQIGGRGRKRETHSFCPKGLWEEAGKQKNQR